MKIATFQEAFHKANRSDNTYSEKVELNGVLRRDLQSDPIKGTVFMSVLFGSGISDGLVELVARSKGITKQAAKKLIQDTKVTTPYGDAFTDSDIASCEGESCVGNGSCTNYRVAEMDADAPEGPSISDQEGLGWWMLGTKEARLESLSKGE